MADSNENDIIELTQMVDDGAPEEEIIDLTQVAENKTESPELTDAADEADAPQPGQLPETETDSNGLTPGDPENRELPDLSGLTWEQIDAAIERVVEKKFSRQIEKILFEVTEKVIKREIADIKAGLQRDIDDIDNA